MKKLSTNAFSLVELLVVVTILAIIIAVGISLNDGYKEKTYNTKVITDLTTIENTFLRYKQENGFIPTPEGNLKYFTNDGSYAHDQTEAYGFHGFITETTIPKKYLIVLPKDPKTKQYYAYGKTLNSGFFEVAGIVLYKDKFESVVKGNFDGKNILYNLIKEYNGPDFVYDKSTKNFPYNPEEMIMTAKISSFAGNLTINNTITDSNTILERELISGDNIKLSSGSTATIYYSDGTVSYLGDSVNPLDMTLSEMKYKKEDNLFTNIRIALNFGTILTKASKMSSDSNFNIYTIDTEASVRGTIFKISRFPDTNKTNVSVIKGEISISKITINDYNNLLKNLENSIDFVTTPIYQSSLNGITLYNLDPSNIDNRIKIFPDQIDNVIEIKLVDGKEESILKEGKSLDILTNPTTGGVVVECLDTQHEENGVCINNTIVGNVVECLDTQHEENGVCIDNTIAGTVVDCLDTQHEENGVCVPNSASCIITNGTGQKYWNLDSKSWGNCIYNCNLNYKLEGGICIINCELGKHEENGVCVDNTVILNTSCSENQEWNGSSCVCKSGYHIINSICESNTASCTITNGTGQKTWDFSNNNRGNCTDIICNTNYNKSGNSCVAATRTYSCPPKPSDTEWNNVFEYLQTWNGSSWSPSDSSTSYNTSGSNTSCRYECISGANRNGSSCIKCSDGFTWDSSVNKCKKTISGNGCNSCPEGYLSSANKIGYCIGGKRYERKCGTQTCKKEEDYLDCNDVTDYPWSITIYQ